MKRFSFPKKNPFIMGVVLATLIAALIGLSITCIHLIAQTTTSAVDTEILRSMQQSVEQTKNNLDYRLQQTADSARTLLGTIYPYLNADSATEEQLQEYSEMTRVLNEYIGKYMIARVRLYVADKKLYSHQNETFFSLSLLENDTEFQALARDRKGGIIWQETSTVTTINGQPMSVISCLAVVSGREDYNQIVGALYLDINVDDINTIFTSSSTDGADLYLINGTGTVIAHSSAEHSPQLDLAPEQIQKISSTALGTIAGDTLIAYNQIDTSGWYIMASASRTSILKPNAATTGLLAILIIATLMVLLVIVIIIAYNITLSRTANMINQAVYALEKQNITVATDTTDSRMDAISRLRSSAGKMVSAAQKIIEERYENRLAISQYQMQALQAQIKPHFLCNTLDVIKWLITDGDTKDSIWMVNKLSKYLRLSFNQDPGAVTLEEELILTENYLSIMKRRFKNAFTVELDIDPPAKECLLPRFSLQPLVENALLHGLLNDDKPDRKLTIRAWLDKDRILIEIEDNGSGMSEKTRSKLETQSVGLDKGYGVANVRERLKLFQGSESAFTISSQKGLGTCVSIILQAQFRTEAPDK